MKRRLCSAVLVAGVFLAAGCGGPRASLVPVVPSTNTAVGITGDALANSKRQQLVVTSKADNGNGSLRDTVAKAEAGSSISFHLPKHARIELTTGPISIEKKITITGPGATQLSISASRKSQIFSIETRVTAAISNLTLRNGSSAQGGAIYNSGTLTIDKVTFKGNVAPGGSAAAVTKPMRMTPRPFRRGGHAIKHAPAPRIAIPDTTGPGAGGAIYNSTHGMLSVTGSTFSGNSAAYGGAIDNAGTATLRSDAFRSNTGYHGSNPFGYGAAIYDSGKITVTSCTFTANVAGGKSPESFGAGGAIAQVSGAAKIVDSVFDSNVAGGGSSGSWGTGGGIYSTAGSLTINGSSFSANTAGGDSYGYGGGVYSDQHFTGSKNTFSQNSAYGTSDEGGAYGGAVYAGSGLSLTASTFTTNKASGSYAYGGAVDAEFNSLLSADSFTGNAASGNSGRFAEGGGIYLGGGNSTFTSLKFTTNRASATGTSSFASGGAVAAFAGLAVGGASSFSANSATVTAPGGLGAEGGALAIEQGPLTFTGSIVNNTSTTQGGGLWVDGSATVTSSTISGNTVAAMQAANDGGAGVYASYAGTLTMTASTIASNIAYGDPVNAGGGGIFNAGGATITNSTIENNTSSADGGGLENDAAGNVSLVNVTIYANSASQSGGNLKNLYADAAISIANSILAGGSASDSPNDVSNDGSIVSGDYNIVQYPVAGNAIGGTTAHNLTVDPQLSDLASNGGSTQTSADGKNSPGTAYVPFNNCLQFNIIVDQRGLPRDPKGNDSCDVGAYENQNP